jgi:selenocysteine-specific elongation factor
MTQVCVLNDEWVIDAATVQTLQEHATKALDGYKTRYPLRIGMPREELRRRLGIEPGVLEALLTVPWQGIIERCGDGLLRRVGSVVTLTDAQQRLVDGALASLRQQPYAPPPTGLDRELQQYLIGGNQLVDIGADVAFSHHAWHEMTTWILTTIDSEGQVTVGQFRDRFGTTRKYALAVLEYLDEKRVTRRRDDARVRF